MKKEDLLKIEGMTDEIAVKVAEISAEELKSMVPKTRLNEVIKERDTAKSNHADVLKQLGILQKEAADTDVDGLKAKIATLETDAKDAAKKHAAEIYELRVDNAVNAALLSAKALNIKAVKALLNLDNAELDADGAVKGLDDQIKTLKGADDSKMLFGSIQMRGAKYGESKDDDDGDHAPDMSKMTYDELAAYIENNPNAAN